MPSKKKSPIGIHFFHAMPASPEEAKDSARPRVRDEKRCKESLVQRSGKIQATKQAANKKK